MKKRIAIIVVVLACGLLAVSCHSKEICPAYADSSETVEAQV